MEATENDLPPSLPFQVSGFPTIKFKPAGSRDFLDYDGDRSLESLVEFVEASAKNSLEPPTPPPVLVEDDVQVPLPEPVHVEEEASHDEL